MAINYQINSVKSPQGAEGEEKIYFYPRVVRKDEKDLEHIAAVICDQNSLTDSDVLACVVALTSQIRFNLMHGATVNLNGLGKFSLKLKADPPIPQDGKPVANSIQVDSIHFTPDPDLLRYFRSANLVSQSSEPKPIVTKVNRMRIIEEFLHNTELASISQITRATGMNYSTVRKDLHEMHQQGVLHGAYIGSNKFYRMNNR